MPTITKEQLLSIVREQHLSSIASLTSFLRKEKLECSDEELIRLIGQLSSDGSLVFGESQDFSSFSAFVGSPSNSWWVYAIILLSALEMLLVTYGPGDPLSVSFRLVLGIALLGFFPGYSSLRAVFPRSQLTFLEKIVLSIFLSVLVSILSGTILGATLLLDATANVIVLTMFTVVTTLIAGYRVFSSGVERP